MEINILDCADKIIQTRHNWVDQAHRFKNKIKPVSNSLTAFFRICPENVSVNIWSEEIEVRIAITDMVQIEPFVQSLQEITGFEFDATEDQTEYGKFRKFKMSKFPLSLFADVSESPETANCKAVQVGEKITPVYEIKCSET